MAGFEGPRDPEAPGSGAPKLPSWAVTRKQPVDDEPDPAGFAALGPEPAPTTVAASRGEPPVVQVPAHPFDVDDPFGDKMGGVASPWNKPPETESDVQVVDLADEFGLTTVEALEVCAASGTPVRSGAAWLTTEQAAAFRTAAASYDRSSAAAAAEHPDWAVPPGGRRPGPAGRGAQVVPGATLLASRGPSTDDDDRPKGRTFRIVLLLVAILLAVAFLAYVLAR